MLAITGSEIASLVRGDHPFEFLQLEGLETTMANYFAMSQAFPYLQAGSQKKLYDHYLNHDKLIDKELEITSVVGNFLTWDETGGLNVTLRRKLVGISDILKTDQNFHANMLRQDLLKIFGREIVPLYSRVTRAYLDRLYENLADPNIVTRTATMVSFEAHAGKMITALWGSLSKLFPETPRDHYRYFYGHVGGDDPAEMYHVKMTEELIAFAVDTPEKREQFLEHFADMYSMHKAWCEDISQPTHLGTRTAGRVTSTPESILYETPAVRAARADLALALRAAAHYGLGEGICNHFSLAVPGDARYFLLNPRGVLWGEVKAGDIVMVDARGLKVAGEHSVEPTAMNIHAAIHNVLGASCVLHSHMPYTTALSMMEGERFDTSLSQNALRFHGRVQHDIKYGGLALDAIEGERIARAMHGYDVALLSNHGAIVTGANVADALEDLYYLERAAMVQVLFMSTGKARRAVPPETARQAAGQFGADREQAQLFFAALRRLLPE